MLIMGFNGGVELAHEDHLHMGQHSFTLHDAAAVLLDDGKVVAAIEQERLDRIKHSNRAPIDAMRFCLRERGVRIDEIDVFANYTSRESVAYFLKRRVLMEATLRGPRRAPTPLDPVEFFRQLFVRAFDYAVPTEKLEFVRHHVAHAYSAFSQSGLERALVLTIDGEGEGESGRVFTADAAGLKPLKTFPSVSSLGHYYDAVIRFLGFDVFDEYKVMGLAPYGDAARFRELFSTFYSLGESGDYAIYPMKQLALFSVLRPRERGAPIIQLHHDLAAALQESLEKIVLHVLDHFRAATGEKNLCLAGGVAHNCTLNGKILGSGRFEQVFVQPASHDAGCALGAALQVHAQRSGDTRAPRLEHVFFGTDVGDAASIRATLSAWGGLVDHERLDDTCRQTAKLLADGSVIGWVQGRSEFGPRALGNRSILADPRPAENKDIINRMVKKRESFRPFAPAVLEEDAHAWFDLPAGVAAPYMVFVVDVRPERRATLGAVTHVDGTARVQTVSAAGNERFARLLGEWKALTSVPVLLNTSFNNNAEPIVDSVEDAIVCFLTTQLNYLVVGDFLVRKRPDATAATRKLVPRLPPHIKLVRTRRWNGTAYEEVHDLGVTADWTRQTSISADAAGLVGRFGHERSIDALLDEGGLVGEARERVAAELGELWSLRLIALAPARSG